MTQDGTSKDDVKVPEGELGDQISAGFDEGKDLLVTIVSAMGEEQVCSGLAAIKIANSSVKAISFKEAPKGN